MGSVDRSANKRGLHDLSSGLTKDSVGRPRAAVDAGEMKGEKCLNRRIVGHGPPAHRNGKPERRATGGRLSLERGALSRARSTCGAVRTATRGNRPGPVDVRSAQEWERRLASHPNRRQRGARAENSDRLHECPLPRWMISTQLVLTRRNLSKGRASGRQV